MNTHARTHAHTRNGWEPDTCQSCHSSVAQYRHTTAASFAPFPWRPARAHTKHSLLPSGVSVKLLTIEPSRESLGGERMRVNSSFFCKENRYCSDAKVWKPLSQQCSASERVMESARKSCVTSVEGILTCGRKRARLFQINTGITLVRKATAVQFLLYSGPLANMFSDQRQTCDETLRLRSKI